MKHVMDYVVTHDEAAQRLVVATGCGRAELDLRWATKQKPDLQDAAQAVMWLHSRLCSTVGLQVWDCEVGTITFEGVAHHSAPQEAGDNGEPQPTQRQPLQTDLHPIPPALSESP